MNRVRVEYTKAVLMAAFAVATAVLVIIGHSSPTMIFLPAVIAVLAIYFWWKADATSKDRD